MKNNTAVARHLKEEAQEKPLWKKKVTKFKELPVGRTLNYNNNNNNTHRKTC